MGTQDATFTALAIALSAEGGFDQVMVARAAALLAIIVGLILWSVGSKILKPATVTIGAFLGGLLGWTVAGPMLPAQVGPLTGGHIGAGVGGLVGLALALATFRLALSVVTAATFASIGALGAAVYIASTPPQDTSATTAAVATHETQSPSISLAGFGLSSHTDDSLPIGASLASKQALAEVAERVPQEVSELASSVVADASSAWSALPAPSRAIFAGTILATAIFGLVVGGLSPRRASVLVTAAVGSALWLWGLVSLAGDLHLPGIQPLHDSHALTLAIWAALAALGLIIQRTRRQPEPAED
ncbi:MAG: hypothetical protein AB7Q00_11495 [Phycisphaerales bacterium]